MIARLFDVTDGAILINDVDIREFRLEDLWSLLGLVPQAAFLFSGTVGDNLRYGRADASDDALWQALDIAQARDFVAALPEQLQAPVAQGGTGFSGGQRQRLTIARALVRQAPIYLLDDSFSALDYVTDARLRSALRSALRDAAVLIVGQRVSSLRHADTILLIEEGVIVAAGTHEHLMQESAGYREIVDSRTRVTIHPSSRYDAPRREVPGREAQDVKSQDLSTSPPQGQRGGPQMSGPRMGAAGMASGARARNLGGTLRRLVGLFGARKASVVAIVLCTAGSVLLSVLVPWQLGRATNSVVDAVSTGRAVDFTALAHLLLVAAALQLGAMLLNWRQAWLTTDLVQGMSRTFRQQAEGKLFRLPLPWSDRSPTASSAASATTSTTWGRVCSNC